VVDTPAAIRGGRPANDPAKRDQAGATAKPQGTVRASILRGVAEAPGSIEAPVEKNAAYPRDRTTPTDVSRL
jgi:hypothetical protein